MNVPDKIYQLMNSNHWSLRDLANKSGLPLSTIAGIVSEHRVPKMDTLEQICAAFGITLSEFFMDAGISDETKALIANYNKLSKNTKDAINKFIDQLAKE